MSYMGIILDFLMLIMQTFLCSFVNTRGIIWLLKLGNNAIDWQGEIASEIFLTSPLKILIEKYFEVDKQAHKNSSLLILTMDEIVSP